MGTSQSPLGRKLVKCKWVFKNKFDADGSNIKYESGLVAKGFSQFKGIDYNDTFASIAKMDSIRLVLAMQLQAMGSTSHGCKELFNTW